MTSNAYQYMSLPYLLALNPRPRKEEGRTKPTILLCMPSSTILNFHTTSLSPPLSSLLSSSPLSLSTASSLSSSYLACVFGDGVWPLTDIDIGVCVVVTVILGRLLTFCVDWL